MVPYYSVVLFGIKDSQVKGLSYLNIVCSNVLAVLQMFFGSMLVLISVDLMWEWLVVASGKMMGTEYAICLATFVAIMVGGIETGPSVRASISSDLTHSLTYSIKISHLMINERPKATYSPLIS